MSGHTNEMTWRNVMHNDRYGGKRAYRGRRSHSGSESSILWRTIGRVAFFPILFVYLEWVLHIAMGMDLRYFIIYTLFALSMGCLFSAITMPFKRKVNRVLVKVLAMVVSLIYVIEMIAKKILQNYYPFSTLGLASENHLTDYTSVIVSTVVRNIPLILVLLLPAILVIAFGCRVLLFPRTDVRFAGAMVGVMVVLHLLALGTVHLPWGGDLTPAQLYKVDTNLDDQVEQLGLVTMLRLDIKHMFVPAGTLLDDNFDDLPVTNPSEQPSDPVESGDPDASATPVIDTSPNVMDVDLEAVANSTDNEDIQWLAKYFNSVTPTNKNEYTGMFEGYNVILFVLEGFSGYALDPELTPTLWKMANEGFVFNNYYTALHFTSTSNGECQTLLGLYPKNGNPSTMKRTGELGTNCYFSLAQQLGRLGYTTLGYHDNQDMYGRSLSHPNLGYTWKQYVKGHNGEPGTLLCEEVNGDRAWPQRDKYMIEVSVDDYIHDDTPFHVYYLTVSGHTKYGWNRVASQYRDLVSDLPYSEKTQAYIAAAAIEVDRAMEALLDSLEAAGKLDNTLIVATGDHIPYADVDVLEELAGKTFGSSEDLEFLRESDIDFDVYKNTLIMWSASMDEPVEVDKVCCQVDILPTVSNLLGLEYDSRMLAGSDILSDSEGLVIFTSRSWKSDRGFYNRYTQEFTPAEGVTMTAEEQEEYVSAMRRLVGYKLDSTELIVENDFYDYVFNQFQG